MSNLNPSSGLTQSQSQLLHDGQEPLQYSVPSGLLDDVHAADGSVKPQWQYLLSSFRDLGPQALEQREEKIQRILRDEGATFNLAHNWPQLIYLRPRNKFEENGVTPFRESRWS